MFNKETEILLQTTKKILKEVRVVASEESKKIDKEWLEKVNTTRNSIDGGSNDTRTISEVIASAKKERDYLSNKLSLYSNNTEKQMNISKRLYDLNTVISSYEDAFSEKENRKFDILKNKETDIIASMLDELIEKTDKEISTLKSNIDSNLEELRVLAGQVNFEKITKKLENSNKKLVEFGNLRKSLEKLRTYNGNIDSDKKLIQLISNLQDYNKYIITTCYNLIVSNNVDLSKPFVKNNVDETKQIEEIEKLLDESESNKDINKLEEAKKLINNLTDEKEKKRLTEKASEIDSFVNEDEQYALADDAVKVIEKADKICAETGKIEDIISKNDIEKAEQVVEQLENNKDKLQKRLDIVKRNIQKRFIDLLLLLEKKVDSDELEYVDVKKLEKMFNELVNFGEFDKNIYGSRVSEIINEYNVQAQDRYQAVAATRENKVKFGDRLLQLIASPVELALRTKWARKLRKNRLEKLEASGKDLKVEKQRNKMKEYDIVNGVKLFKSRNNIAKLKPTLYRYGFDGLSKKQTRKYYSSIENISMLLYNGLINPMEDKDVMKDSERAKIVISQLFKQLSATNYDVSETDYDKSMFGMSIEAFRGFLIDTYKSGGITKNEFISYNDEINSIEYYKKKNNNMIYEVSLNEIEDETSKYYQNPVTYTDSDAKKALPHIKTYGKN